MKSILLFASALLLLCTLNASAVDVYPAEKFLAPDFELRGVDGKKHKLSDYRGKIVFLNFWATWCQPCRVEMPEMEKLKEAMKGKDFEMIAVGIDQKGLMTVKPFIRKNKFSFNVLADPGGRIVTNLYRLSNGPIPVTFIVDKEGMILKKFYGGRDWSSHEYVHYFNDLTAN